MKQAIASSKRMMARALLAGQDTCVIKGPTVRCGKYAGQIGAV